MELWVVIAIFGGIVALDTTAGPQIMIAEPLVSGTLLGLLFGMPGTGVLLGMLFQLLWLGYLPLGAVRFVDHGMGGFIGCAALLAAARMFSLDGAQIRAAVLPVMCFGVLAGIAGLRLSDFIRDWNAALSERLVEWLEGGGSASIAVSHFRGMSRVFLKGAGMTAVLVPAGAFLCGLVRYAPVRLMNALGMGTILITGTVLAASAGFYWLNGRRRYLVLGSIGGLAWFLMALVHRG